MQERKWFVIQTKPRNEKKVFEQIVKKDIEVFLPLLQTIRLWSDRKKKIQVPMFPGYIFVHGNENERVNAISNTFGAMRYVMYQKRPAVLSDSEITSIKISLLAPERIRIEETSVSVGDLVEITHGIFRGLKGYIVQFRGNYKLIVNIIELNTAFSVQLNSSEVRRINEINN